jgi:hypothetical protein
MFFAGGRGRGPENEAAYALLFYRSSSVNDIGSLGCCFYASAVADAYRLIASTTTQFSSKHFFVTNGYFVISKPSQINDSFLTWVLLKTEVLVMDAELTRGVSSAQDTERIKDTMRI